MVLYEKVQTDKIMCCTLLNIDYFLLLWHICEQHANAIIDMQKKQNMRYLEGITFPIQKTPTKNQPIFDSIAYS